MAQKAGILSNSKPDEGTRNVIWVVEMRLKRKNSVWRPTVPNYLSMREAAREVRKLNGCEGDAIFRPRKYEAVRDDDQP